jgi:predicted DNA binding protein
MQQSSTEKEQNPAGTRLTLNLWHPNCWAIGATEQVDGGGVLAHAIYDNPTTETSSVVNGLFSVFGETTDEVEELLATIESSQHSGSVRELQTRFGQRGSPAPANVVREFFLEYRPGDMICPTLLKHGFVHSAPVRIENGRETWKVVFAGEREEIAPQLDKVRADGLAEVTVESVSSADPSNGGVERQRRLDTLTPTQREVFKFAREEGYYEWPRGISTRELARKFDVSKTTFLEHLRKAEAKLLDP